MSLDVILSVPGLQPGETHNCPHCKCGSDPVEVWRGNVTHNLARMAEAAGVYYVCWRPGEAGISKAGDMVEPLKAGIAWLDAKHPDELAAFLPENGWGDEGWLRRFLAGYLSAAEDFPHATVWSWA